MSSTQSFTREYSLLHLLVAAGLALVLSLTALFVMAAVIEPGTKLGIVAPSAQILALVIVFAFYSVPLVPGKKAPLSALRGADKHMMYFAVIGFVGSLIAPAVFPVDSLPVGSPGNTAISVLGLSAVLTFPLGMGAQALLVLVARHVEPIVQNDDDIS